MSCVCGAERCQKGFFLSYGNQSKVGWKLLHQAAATVSTVAMKLLLLQIQLHYQQDSYSLGVHKRLEPDPVSRKHATASCVSWVGLVWCLTELQGDSCKQTRHTATQGRENEWMKRADWVGGQTHHQECCRFVSAHSVSCQTKKRVRFNCLGAVAQFTLDQCDVCAYHISMGTGWRGKSVCKYYWSRLQDEF